MPPGKRRPYRRHAHRRRSAAGSESNLSYYTSGSSLFPALPQSAAGSESNPSSNTLSSSLFFALPQSAAGNESNHSSNTLGSSLLPALPQSAAGSESNLSYNTFGGSLLPVLPELPAVPQPSGPGNTSILQDLGRIPYFSASSINPESTNQNNMLRQALYGNTNTAVPAPSWYGTSSGYASLRSAPYNFGNVTHYNQNMAYLAQERLAQEMVHRVRMQQLLSADIPTHICPDPSLHFRNVTPTPVASNFSLTGTASSGDKGRSEGLSCSSSGYSKSTSSMYPVGESSGTYCTSTESHHESPCRGNRFWPPTSMNEEPLDLSTKKDRTKGNSEEQKEGTGNKGQEGHGGTSEAAPTGLSTAQTRMETSSREQRIEDELQVLKRSFSESNYLTPRKKKKLADELNLDEGVIIKWFERHRKQHAENKTIGDISASQTKAGCAPSSVTTSSELNNAKYSQSAVVPEKRIIDMTQDKNTIPPVSPTELCGNTNSQPPPSYASSAPENSSSKGKSKSQVLATTVASSLHHDDQCRSSFALTVCLQQEARDTTLSLPLIEPSGNTNSQPPSLDVSKAPEQSSMIGKSCNQVSTSPTASTRPHDDQPLPCFALTFSLKHEARDTTSYLPPTEPSDNMNSESLSSVAPKHWSLTSNNSTQEASRTATAVRHKHEQGLPSPAATVSSQHEGRSTTMGLFPSESSDSTNSQASSQFSLLPIAHAYLMGNSSIQVPPATTTEANNPCEPQYSLSPALTAPSQKEGFGGWNPLLVMDTSSTAKASNQSSINHNSVQFRKDSAYETDESSDSSS